MNKLLKILLGVLISILTSFAYETNDKIIYQKDFESNIIYLPLNNFRILVFSERVQNIQLTNSVNIRAEFIDNYDLPLQKLKVLGRAIGNESAIVTLESGKTIQINFSIMQNLDSIISIVKSTYPNLIIEQANDTIVLKGYVKNYKERDLVIDIFKKAGININEKLVDMIETLTPSKMIRVKLYAVEINNDKGLNLKNNWTLSSKNFFQVAKDDDLAMNMPLRKDSWGKVNNQRIVEQDNAINKILTNAVSLAGGLSGAANYLGKYFNVSLVLSYLAKEGVANILEETTLITLENKEATFHAGGTIRIKTQTTTAEGVPSTDVEKIKYGLQLKIKAKNVMKDNYVDLEITTSNTKIDWSNTVEGIPSFLENEVVTNVMAKNSATIILGGLINSQNSYDISKIPTLGDIPILGFLFRSKVFKEGKSELVFFITPEIIDPATNEQNNDLIKTKNKMLDASKYINKDNLFEQSFKKPSEKKEKEKIDNKLIIKKEPQRSSQEEHERRVNKILGYE